MEKKYELVEVEGSSYYRIRALRDFSDVKKGDIGGFVEGEHNLSHDGNCWIYDDAIVTRGSRVYENAVIKKSSYVTLESEVYGDAIISNSYVLDQTKVFERAVVRDYSIISQGSMVFGDSDVINNSCIYNYSIIFGDTTIDGNVIPRMKNCYLSSNLSYMHMVGIGKQSRAMTFYISPQSEILVICNEFEGTLHRFRKHVSRIADETSLTEYLGVIDIVKWHFLNSDIKLSSYGVLA